jgi:hypothetical protein
MAIYPLTNVILEILIFRLLIVIRVTCMYISANERHYRNDYTPVNERHSQNINRPFINCYIYALPKYIRTRCSNVGLSVERRSRVFTFKYRFLRLAINN